MSHIRTGKSKTFSGAQADHGDTPICEGVLSSVEKVFWVVALIASSALREYASPLIAYLLLDVHRPNLAAPAAPGIFPINRDTT